MLRGIPKNRHFLSFTMRGPGARNVTFPSTLFQNGIDYLFYTVRLKYGAKNVPLPLYPRLERRHNFRAGLPRLRTSASLKALPWSPPSPAGRGRERPIHGPCSRRGLACLLALSPCSKGFCGLEASRIRHDFSRRIPSGGQVETDRQGSAVS